jgi:hypothetical protein
MLMGTHALRREQGFTGQGVRLGVISDGADRFEDVNEGVFHELTPGKVVRNEQLRTRKGHEGTAMMEIIHDIAPDAELFFAGVRNTAEYVHALDWFASHGVNIIVDDLGGEFESWFDLRDDVAPIIERTRELVRHATGTTNAAGGVNARVQFTSVHEGTEWGGYKVVFADDPAITVGNETVAVDPVAKTITFRIDAGNTRALEVVNGLNNDATANQFFRAALPAGGDGAGIIDVGDTVTTSGILFIGAAGNEAQRYYQSPLRLSEVAAGSDSPLSPGFYHTFEPGIDGGEPVLLNRITIPALSKKPDDPKDSRMLLKWSDAYDNPQHNFSLVVFAAIDGFGLPRPRHEESCQHGLLERGTRRAISQRPATESGNDAVCRDPVEWRGKCGAARRD